MKNNLTPENEEKEMNDNSVDPVRPQTGSSIGQKFKGIDRELTQCQVQ